MAISPAPIVTVDGFPSVPIDVDAAGYQDFTVPLSLLTGGQLAVRPLRQCRGVGHLHRGGG